jgi:hypothetical protein
MFRRAVSTFLLASTLVSSVAVADAAQNVAAAAGDAPLPLTTFVPSVIPLNADDIVNPFRGAHAWGGVINPSSWPYLDVYARDEVSWYLLEPSEGVYDFSRIDKYLAEAHARGGKFGFRIMAANTDAGQQHPFVPKYLWSRMPRAYTYVSNGVTVYMPDFDDQAFVDRARALINALGARYATDPRLGWIEAGFMGLWGEWHVSDAPHYVRANSLGTHHGWSVAHGQQIVDAWRLGFPTTRLIVMTADVDVMDYALNLDPRIGWRHDCLGSDSLDGGLSNNPGYLNHTERWKTAPIFWEGCGERTSVRMAYDQVIRYHFAGGHTLNQPVASTLSAADQALLKEYRELAGYRFQIDNMALPAELQPGEAFTATSSWSNTGLTPAYTPWTLKLQLRDQASGSVAWEATSGFDFQSFLPTRDPTSGNDSPISRTDDFTLGEQVAPGTYTATATAIDATGYYRPLALANTGRLDDGSYALGSVTVAR